jgi:hypothetical protein
MKSHAKASPAAMKAAPKTSAAPKASPAKM